MDCRERMEGGVQDKGSGEWRGEKKGGHYLSDCAGPLPACPRGNGAQILYKDMKIKTSSEEARHRS